MTLETAPSIENMKIAVLVGGPGSEREVSLHSGAAVADAIRSLGAEVSVIDVKDASFDLPFDLDIAFNMVHGTFGEDGQLQAILDERGIPYTGEGTKGSRLAFDKLKSKACFEKAGISTPEWQMLSAGESPHFPKPYVLKPPCEGSSVGVHIVREGEDAIEALFDCLRYDEKVLVERFIEGRELTVGIIGDEALPIIEIVPVDAFYTYHSKYAQGGSKHLCPASLEPTTTRKIQALALAAHRALSLEVYSRVDVMLDASDNAYVLEVNTIPGMTRTSLLPDAAAVAGISFAQLCTKIIELSLKKERSVALG